MGKGGMWIAGLAMVSLAVAACDTTGVPPERGASSPFLAAAPVPGERLVRYTHVEAERFYRQGRYVEAERMCRQGIADAEKSDGPTSPQIAEPLIDLATVQMRLARYDEARESIERAESVLDAAKPPHALLLGRLGINKGWRLYTLGSPRAAQRVFEESRALLEKHGPADSVDLAEILNNLALMYGDTAEDTGDRELERQARVLLLRAWQMRRRLTGEESPETIESLHNLGMHLLFNFRSFQEAKDAVELLRQSVDLAIKVYGPEHAETASSRTSYALALLIDEQREEAEEQVRQAMPVTLKTLGPLHPDRAGELITLSNILISQKHYREAEELLLEAVKITEHVFGETHPKVASPLRLLRTLYEITGDIDKEQEASRRIELLTTEAI